MRRRNFLSLFGGTLCCSAVPSSVLSGSGYRSLQLARPDENASVLVKVLGTAQDGGIPHVGCSCSNCARARLDPRRARLIASLAIADPGLKRFFLIDATPDIRSQLDLALQMFGSEPPPLRESLAGVLLTHAHIGHYTGLMFFGYESMSADRLAVYASSRMARFLKENGPWSQLVRLGNIELRPLVPEESLSLTETVSITPFLVPHRDEYSDTLGLKISGPAKTLLYIPDIQSWESWDRSITVELGETDFALLDGTFFGPEELPGRDLAAIGHPPIRDSLKIFAKLGNERKAGIFFTHLNHSNLALDPDGESRSEMERAGFRLASEGQVFVL